MSTKPIDVVYGAGGIGSRPPYDKEETVKDLLVAIEKHGIKTIDTAQLYGPSEAFLGRANAGDKFVIDTKWTAGWGDSPPSTKDHIISSAKKSIQTLGVEQVDIFYMHSPDTRVSLADTLAGVNEVYKLGLFKRFGLSNYTAAGVEEVYDHCKQNNYVLPTAYQGNYSAVARRSDTELLPILRKLGIAFYAYSPMAGGFLTKSKDDIAKGAGRFNKEALGGMYLDMYGKPAMLEALAEWGQVANEVGCSRGDLAYRWVAYNSPLKREYGDAMIISARSHEQLEQSMKGLSAGPLPKSAVEKIDHIWELVKHEAPLDNFNR